MASILPLAGIDPLVRLSTSEQNELERRRILAILQEQGFKKVELYDQMDMNFFLQNRRTLNDPAQRGKKLNSSLATSYFWAFADTSRRQPRAGTIGIHREVYEMNPPITDMTFCGLLASDFDWNPNGPNRFW